MNARRARNLLLLDKPGKRPIYVLAMIKDTRIVYRRDPLLHKLANSAHIKAD